MAKVNWNNFSNQFGNAFTSTFLQTQKLAQQEAQFSQEMNFQNRQLQLGEAFRRDELKATVDYHNMQGEYYDVLERQGDERVKLARDEGITNMLGQGFTQVDERTSPAPADVKTYEAYGKSWIAPPMKPEELARWETDKFGNQVEAKGYWKDGEWVTTNYETVVSPPTSTNGNGNGGNGYVDISNEVGQVNKYLTAFKEFERRGLSDTDKITMEKDGEEVGMDKSLLRANVKQYTEDMLTKVGIPSQGNYTSDIRTEAGVVEYGKEQWKSFSGKQRNEIAKARETALLDVISDRLRKGEINQQQYEALRYWAIAGTK